MIRRNTWILVVVFAALVGLSFYVRDLKARQAAEATPTVGTTTLFSAAEGNPTDIKIESGIGAVVEISRDPSGTWVLKSPRQTAANQASAEAAATQVTALHILANVELGLDIAGLDKPAYTVTVVLGSGETHKLLVGSVTPVQDGYYCQLDLGPIVVVDKFGLDALLDLLTNPPYLATLTPVASATPSPGPTTPTPEVTLTPATSVPQGSVTATP